MYQGPCTKFWLHWVRNSSACQVTALLQLLVAHLSPAAVHKEGSKGHQGVYMSCKFCPVCGPDGTRTCCILHEELRHGHAYAVEIAEALESCALAS